MIETKPSEVNELNGESWIGGSGLAALAIGAIGIWPSSGSFGFFGIVLGPLGIFLARAELRLIEAGERSTKGRVIAKIGLVLGIIQTVLGSIWVLIIIIIIIAAIISSGGVS